MGYYGAAPLAFAILLVLAVAASPAMRLADPLPGADAARIPQIDGLRGLLALAVYFHHAGIYHDMLATGRWRTPPSHLFQMLGQDGVALFFVITGYLFWGRLLREHGRPAWARLYTGRLFRIAPVYLLAVAGVFAGVAVATGGRLAEPLAAIVAEVLPWLALGVLDPVDINGLAHTERLIANVIWSLRYEWLFYACLPLLALTVRLRRPIFVAGGGLVAALALVPVCGEPAALAALFLAGMVSASLERAGRLPRLAAPLASLGVAALLAATLAFWSAFAVLPVLLLGAAFALVVSGATLFGLLLTRPVRRLGEASYGIYLLQGLVLAALFQPARAFAQASPAGHWTLAVIGAVAVVLVASVVHAAVERPGIAVGRRVGAWFYVGTGPRLPPPRSHTGARKGRGKM